MSENDKDMVYDVPHYLSGRIKNIKESRSQLGTFIRISEFYLKLTKQQKFSLLEKIAEEFNLELKA
jgi:hypothetical protein